MVENFMGARANFLFLRGWDAAASSCFVCVCVFTILLLLFMKLGLSTGQMIVVKWDLQCKSCCMPRDPVGLKLVEWVGRSSSRCMWKFLNQWERLAPKPSNLQLSFVNRVVDKCTQVLAWILSWVSSHTFQ
jgi:hypothetical protein